MQKRHRRRATLAAAAVAVALLASACSSSGSKGSTTTSNAGGASSAGSSAVAPPTGTPIKIMAIESLTAQGTSTYPESVSAAKAAALAVNAQGGIKGHPLQIEVCDDQVNPNTAATCGNTAVSDKVSAVVSGSFYSSSFIDAFQNANLPYMSPALTNIDWTSKVAFNIVPASLTQYTACVKQLADKGAKKIAFASLDVAIVTAEMPYLISAVGKSGATSEGNVPIPVTAVDYAQYAQTLSQKGADGVVLLGGIAEVGGVLRAAAEIGYKPTWCTEDAFTYDQVKQLAPTDNGLLYMTGLPIPLNSTLPGIKTFESQMAAEKATGDSSASILTTGSEAAWLSVWAFADVLKTAADPTSSASLLTALQATNSLDLFGLTTWQPNKAGPSPLTRLPNGNVYVNSVVNGVPTSNGQPPIDAYTLFGS